MKLPSIVHRFFTLLTSLALAFPGPVFALRQLEPTQNSGLEEGIAKALGQTSSPAISRSENSYVQAGTGLEEDLPPVTDEQIEEQAQLGARVLLAAEKMRADTATENTGPVILFQNLWMGAFYPPMTEDVKDAFGVVEITAPELKQLGQTSSEMTHQAVALTFLRGVLGPQRFAQLRESRFVLVKYKLSSVGAAHAGRWEFGVMDPSFDESDDIDFPEKSWRALMRLSTAFQSNVLMVDYSTGIESGAMVKAGDRFYHRNVFPSSERDASIYMYFPHLFQVRDSSKPFLFFVNPANLGPDKDKPRALRGFAPFDRRTFDARKDVLAPYRYAQDDLLMQRLGTKVLKSYSLESQKGVGNEKAGDAAGLEEKRIAIDIIAGKFRDAVHETLTGIDLSSAVAEGHGVILDTRIGDGVLAIAAGLEEVGVAAVVVEPDPERRRSADRLLLDTPVLSGLEEAAEYLIARHIEPVVLTPVITPDPSSAVAYLQQLRLLPLGNLQPLLAVGLEEGAFCEQIGRYL